MVAVLTDARFDWDLGSIDYGNPIRQNLVEDFHQKILEGRLQAASHYGTYAKPKRATNQTDRGSPIPKIAPSGPYPNIGGGGPSWAFLRSGLGFFCCCIRIRVPLVYIIPLV